MHTTSPLRTTSLEKFGSAGLRYNSNSRSSPQLNTNLSNNSSNSEIGNASYSDYDGMGKKKYIRNITRYLNIHRQCPNGRSPTQDAGERIETEVLKEPKYGLNIGETVETRIKLIRRYVGTSNDPFSGDEDDSDASSDEEFDENIVSDSNGRKKLIRNVTRYINIRRLPPPGVSESMLISTDTKREKLKEPRKGLKIGDTIETITRVIRRYIGDRHSDISSDEEVEFGEAIGEDGKRRLVRNVTKYVNIHKRAPRGFPQTQLLSQNAEVEKLKEPMYGFKKGDLVETRTQTIKRYVGGPLDPQASDNGSELPYLTAMLSEPLSSGSYIPKIDSKRSIGRSNGFTDSDNIDSDVSLKKTATNRRNRSVESKPHISPNLGLRIDRSRDSFGNNSFSSRHRSQSAEVPQSPRTRTRLAKRNITVIKRRFNPLTNKHESVFEEEEIFEPIAMSPKKNAIDESSDMYYDDDGEEDSEVEKKLVLVRRYITVKKNPKKHSKRPRASNASKSSSKPSKPSKPKQSYVSESEPVPNTKPGARRPNNRREQEPEIIIIKKKRNNAPNKIITRKVTYYRKRPNPETGKDEEVLVQEEIPVNAMQTDNFIAPDNIVHRDADGNPFLRIIQVRKNPETGRQENFESALPLPPSAGLELSKVKRSSSGRKLVRAKVDVKDPKTGEVKETDHEEELGETAVCGPDFIAPSLNIVPDEDGEPCVNVIRQRYNPEKKRVENFMDKEPVNVARDGPTSFVCVRNDTVTGEPREYLVDAEQQLKPKKHRKKIYYHVLRVRKNPKTGKDEVVECDEEVPQSALDDQDRCVLAVTRQRYDDESGRLVDYQAGQEITPSTMDSEPIKGRRKLVKRYIRVIRLIPNKKTGELEPVEATEAVYEPETVAEAAKRRKAKKRLVRKAINVVRRKKNPKTGKVEEIPYEEEVYEPEELAENLSSEPASLQSEPYEIASAKFSPFDSFDSLKSSSAMESSASKGKKKGKRLRRKSRTSSTIDSESEQDTVTFPGVEPPALAVPPMPESSSKKKLRNPSINDVVVVKSGGFVNAKKLSDVREPLGQMMKNESDTSFSGSRKRKPEVIIPPSENINNIIDDLLDAADEEQATPNITVKQIGPNNIPRMVTMPIPRNFIRNEDSVVLDPTIHRDENDQPYMNVVKRMKNGSNGQWENVEVPEFVDPLELRNLKFDPTLATLPRNRKGKKVIPVTKTKDRYGNPGEFQHEEEIAEPAIATRDFIAVDPVIRRTKRKRRPYIRVIKQRKHPRTAKPENFECEEEIPELPVLTLRDRDPDPSKVWNVAGKRFKKVQKVIKGNNGIAEQAEVLEEVPAGHSGARTIPVVRNVRNPKTGNKEPQLDEIVVPENAIGNSNFLIPDPTVMRAKDGHPYYVAFKRQIDPGTGKSALFECEEEIPERDLRNAPQLSTENLERNEVGVPCMNIVRVDVDPITGAEIAVPEREEIHWHAVSGPGYIVPSMAVIRTPDGQPCAEVIRQHLDTSTNKFQNALKLEPIDSSLSPASSNVPRMLIREERTADGKLRESLFADRVGDGRPAEERPYAQCIRKRWNPYHARYELYECKAEPSDLSKDEYGRFMMHVIAVRPSFATGLKEEVEEVHELTSYNSADLMKANPKLVRKQIAVIKIRKNKKTGKPEAYESHEDVYEPEYDGDKNKKRKLVKRRIMVTRLRRNPKTGKDEEYEDSMTVYEPEDAEPPLTKWEVDVSKKNSPRASPKEPREIKERFSTPARPSNSSPRLMLSPKELLAELTSQPEARISEGNPEAAGLKVNKPRASKLPQPIGVDENRPYRSQISKHRSNSKKPTTTSERKPEFAYENSDKGSRASTQKPPPMLPSPKFDPTIKPSLIPAASMPAMPTISPKSKKAPPPDLPMVNALSPNATAGYGSIQLPPDIADILEPQAKNESKVSGFKPAHSSMDRYLQKYEETKDNDFEMPVILDIPEETKNLTLAEIVHEERAKQRAIAEAEKKAAKIEEAKRRAKEYDEKKREEERRREAEARARAQEERRQEELRREQQERRKQTEELQDRLRRDGEFYKMDAEKKRREMEREKAKSPHRKAGTYDPPDLRTAGLEKANSPRRSPFTQTDSSDDMIDSSGGDSVLPVIPRSSYFNGSQKSPKHILPSTLSEAVRYSPMKFDPEKSSSDYHYSMSDSYSDDGNEKMRDLDALEPLAAGVPAELKNLLRYSSKPLAAANISQPKDSIRERMLSSSGVLDSDSDGIVPKRLMKNSSRNNRGPTPDRFSSSNRGPTPDEPSKHTHRRPSTESDFSGKKHRSKSIDSSSDLIDSDDPYVKQTKRFSRRPSDESDSKHRSRSQEHHRRPSDETDSHHRRPSEDRFDSGTKHRRPSESDSKHRSRSQERRRPSDESDSKHRRPSEEKKHHSRHGTMDSDDLSSSHHRRPSEEQRRRKSDVESNGHKHRHPSEEKKDSDSRHRRPSEERKSRNPSTERKERRHSTMDSGDFSSSEPPRKKEKSHDRRLSAEKKDRPRRSFVDDHKQSDSDDYIDEPSGSDNPAMKSSKNKKKSPKALYPLLSPAYDSSSAVPDEIDTLKDGIEPVGANILDPSKFHGRFPFDEEDTATMSDSDFTPELSRKSPTAGKRKPISKEDKKKAKSSNGKKSKKDESDYSSEYSDSENESKGKKNKGKKSKKSKQSEAESSEPSKKSKKTDSEKKKKSEKESSALPKKSKSSAAKKDERKKVIKKDTSSDLDFYSSDYSYSEDDDKKKSKGKKEKASGTKKPKEEKKSTPSKKTVSKKDSKKKSADESADSKHKKRSQSEEKKSKDKKSKKVESSDDYSISESDSKPEKKSKGGKKDRSPSTEKKSDSKKGKKSDGKKEKKSDGKKEKKSDGKKDTKGKKDNKGKKAEEKKKSILMPGDDDYYYSEPEAAETKVSKSKPTKDDKKSKKAEDAKGKKPSKKDKKGASSDDEPSTLSGDGSKGKKMNKKGKGKNITPSDEEPHTLPGDAKGKKNAKKNKKGSTIEEEPATFPGEEPKGKKPSKKGAKKGASSDEEPSTLSGEEAKEKKSTKKVPQKGKGEKDSSSNDEQETLPGKKASKKKGKDSASSRGPATLPGEETKGKKQTKKGKSEDESEETRNADSVPQVSIDPATGMPMFPPNDSANSADPLAALLGQQPAAFNPADPLAALINGSSGGDAAAPFQFPSSGANPLETLVMQPKSKSRLQDSTSSSSGEEPVEGERAADPLAALLNQGKADGEEALPNPFAPIGAEQAGDNPQAALMQGGANGSGIVDVNVNVKGGEGTENTSNPLAGLIQPQGPGSGSGIGIGVGSPFGGLEGGETGAGEGEGILPPSPTNPFGSGIESSNPLAALMGGSAPGSLSGSINGSMNGSMNGSAPGSGSGFPGLNVEGNTFGMGSPFGGLESGAGEGEVILPPAPTNPFVPTSDNNPLEALNKSSGESNPLAALMGGSAPGSLSGSMNGSMNGSINGSAPGSGNEFPGLNVGGNTFGMGSPFGGLESGTGEGEGEGEGILPPSPTNPFAQQGGADPLQALISGSASASLQGSTGGFLGIDVTNASPFPAMGSPFGASAITTDSNGNPILTPPSPTGPPESQSDSNPLAALMSGSAPGSAPGSGSGFPGFNMGAGSPFAGLQGGESDGMLPPTPTKSNGGESATDPLQALINQNSDSNPLAALMGSPAPESPLDSAEKGHNSSSSTSSRSDKGSNKGSAPESGSGFEMGSPFGGLEGGETGAGEGEGILPPSPTNPFGSGIESSNPLAALMGGSAPGSLSGSMNGSVNGSMNGSAPGSGSGFPGLNVGGNTFGMGSPFGGLESGAGEGEVILPPAPTNPFVPTSDNNPLAALMGGSAPGSLSGSMNGSVNGSINGSAPGSGNGFPGLNVGGNTFGMGSPFGGLESGTGEGEGEGEGILPPSPTNPFGSGIDASNPLAALMGGSAPGSLSGSMNGSMNGSAPGSGNGFPGLNVGGIGVEPVGGLTGSPFGGLNMSGIGGDTAAEVNNGATNPLAALMGNSSAALSSDIEAKTEQNDGNVVDDDDKDAKRKDSSESGNDVKKEKESDKGSNIESGNEEIGEKVPNPFMSLMQNGNDSDSASDANPFASGAGRKPPTMKSSDDGEKGDESDSDDNQPPSLSPFGGIPGLQPFAAPKSKESKTGAKKGKKGKTAKGKKGKGKNAKGKKGTPSEEDVDGGDVEENQDLQGQSDLMQENDKNSGSNNGENDGEEALPNPFAPIGAEQAGDNPLAALMQGGANGSGIVDVNVNVKGGEGTENTSNPLAGLIQPQGPGSGSGIGIGVGSPFGGLEGGETGAGEGEGIIPPSPTNPFGSGIDASNPLAALMGGSAPGSLSGSMNGSINGSMNGSAPGSGSGFPGLNVGGIGMGSPFGGLESGTGKGEGEGEGILPPVPTNPFGSGIDASNPLAALMGGSAPGSLSGSMNGSMNGSAPGSGNGFPGLNVGGIGVEPVGGLTGSPFGGLNMSGIGGDTAAEVNNGATNPLAALMGNSSAALSSDIEAKTEQNDGNVVDDDDKDAKRKDSSESDVEQKNPLAQFGVGESSLDDQPYDPVQALINSTSIPPAVGKKKGKKGKKAKSADAEEAQPPAVAEGGSMEEPSTKKGKKVKKLKKKAQTGAEEVPLPEEGEGKSGLELGSERSPLEAIGGSAQNPLGALLGGQTGGQDGGASIPVFGIAPPASLETANAEGEEPPNPLGALLGQTQPSPGAFGGESSNPLAALGGDPSNPFAAFGGNESNPLAALGGNADPSNPLAALGGSSASNPLAALTGAAPMPAFDPSNPLAAFGNADTSNPLAALVGGQPSPFAALGGDASNPLAALGGGSDQSNPLAALMGQTANQSNPLAAFSMSPAGAETTGAVIPGEEGGSNPLSALLGGDEKKDNKKAKKEHKKVHKKEKAQEKDAGNVAAVLGPNASVAPVNDDDEYEYVDQEIYYEEEDEEEEIVIQKVFMYEDEDEAAPAPQRPPPKQIVQYEYEEDENQSTEIEEHEVVIYEDEQGHEVDRQETVHSKFVNPGEKRVHRGKIVSRRKNEKGEYEYEYESDVIYN